MKPVMLGAAFAMLFLASAAAGQQQPFTTPGCDPEASFTLRLPQAVVADGQPLAAGSYVVRITTEHPAPAAGQSATGACWVEFVKNGAVAGREVASVIPGADIGAVAKGPAPRPSESKVDLLKEGEYLRVWMNRAGTHYIVHLPVSR